MIYIDIDSYMSLYGCKTNLKIQKRQKIRQQTIQWTKD